METATPTSSEILATVLRELLILIDDCREAECDPDEILDALKQSIETGLDLLD
jgi:hypothetical protein